MFRQFRVATQYIFPGIGVSYFLRRLFPMLTGTASAANSKLFLNFASIDGYFHVNVI